MPAPYTGRLIDFLGADVAANRPASVNTLPGSLALWYATDTGDLDAWDGATWTTVATAGSGAVSSVNGLTGAVELRLQDLLDVILPSGEATDQALLIYDSQVQAWIELPPGGVGDVLMVTTGGIAYVPATGGGDVSGPGSSVDNTVPRFVGATGTDIEDTGVIIGDDDEISGYKALVDLDTAGSYSPTEAESGTIKELSDGAGVTVTLDSQMPKGFSMTLVQMGAGPLSFVPESGGSLVNRQGHTASAGQYAIVVIYVSSNSGSNAVWVLGGDTA